MDWRRSNAKTHTYLKNGAVHIHRTIAESVIGRPLTSKEVVHHVDLDKHNNDLYNLMLLPDQGLHTRIHFGKVSPKQIEKYRLSNFQREAGT
jgi:hypothetical protein